MDDDNTNVLAQVHFIEQNGKFKLVNGKRHIKKNSRHVSEPHVTDHRLEARLFSKFDPNKQTLKIFQSQIPRLVLTLVLLVGYVVTLLTCQAKQPVDRGYKRVFEAVSTGLILGLGLNFFEAFKDLARVARWRILSSRFVGLRKVVLVLGAESLLKVFRLMTLSAPKSLEFRVSIIWLLVNLGAQVLVAILPFFASLKSGYDSTGVTISQGSVAVPKLDCFYRSNVTQCEGDIQRRLDPAIAHVYGEGRSFDDERCRYQSTDQIHRAPQTCRYLARADRREFAVRYADSNPADMINAYPYYGAQRFITVAATGCNGNLTNDPSLADGHDGPKSELVWPYQNSTGFYSLSIPRSILARSSTTYIWNGTAPPPLATEYTCGPRCVVLFALRDMERGPDHEITIFQCRIMISLMSNVKHPAHVLSDSIARTAAASVALSGRWRLGFVGGPPLDWRQFQLYQDGAAWATTLDDSPDDVGARMAEFAASTLTTMAQQNPSTNVTGSLPILGYQTDVEWKSTIGLTVSVAAAHLFMMTLTILLARPIIVVSDKYLTRVMLLRGLMRSASDGDELHLLPGAEITRESEHSTGAEGLERRRDVVVL